MVVPTGTMDLGLPPETKGASEGLKLDSLLLEDRGFFEKAGSAVSTFIGGSAQPKYGILSLVLAAIHLSVSITIARSDEDDQFKVPFVYNFNSWTPQGDNDGTCSSGCIIREERFDFGEPNRLNVNTMIACYGYASASLRPRPRPCLAAPGRFGWANTQRSATAAAAADPDQTYFGEQPSPPGSRVQVCQQSRRLV